MYWLMGRGVLFRSIIWLFGLGTTPPGHGLGVVLRLKSRILLDLPAGSSKIPGTGTRCGLGFNSPPKLADCVRSTCRVQETILRKHTSDVSDISWSQLEEHLLVSASHSIFCWDTRAAQVIRKQWVHVVSLGKYYRTHVAKPAFLLAHQRRQACLNVYYRLTNGATWLGAPSAQPMVFSG